MAKDVINTERISTFIPKSTLETLKQKASEKGMTVSGYIRLLIIQDTTEKQN